MKLKRILISCLFTVFLASPALAVPLYFDLDGVGITGSNGGPDDANNQTDIFDQINFYAETTVTQYDSDGNYVMNAGDAFSDSGNLSGFGMVPINSDDEGMGSWWEFTGVMDSFAGVVSSVSAPDANGDTRIDFAYNSGSLILYADNAMDADFNERGNTDDVGFNTGTKIAEFDLVSGLGHTFLDFSDPNGEVSNQGTGKFVFNASYLIDDFWFDANGEDLADTYNDTLKPVEWVINVVDFNVDAPILTPGAPGPNDNVLFTVDVTHDGSMEFSTVPEPATMLLFGIGLLGLANVSRKRKN